MPDACCSRTALTRSDLLVPWIATTKYEVKRLITRLVAKTIELISSAVKYAQNNTLGKQVTFAEKSLTPFQNQKSKNKSIVRRGIF